MEDEPPMGDRIAPEATETGDLSPELRRLLPRREDKALAAFFDCYFDRIYGYVRRLVQDETQAEDVTQDVFLHIQRAIHTYDPERELRPWIFTIATNKVRDLWRARRMRGASHEDDEDGPGPIADVVSREPRADESLSRTEIEGAVRAAIDALPEGLRMTLLLRVYEGLSFEDIARVVDRNEVAVRKRYSRALEALRHGLEGVWRSEAGGGG
jgi:RNA polymerase sigma-70 factor (ECF subfamily)